MSTSGKVCLVLTILLLIVACIPVSTPYAGWVPQLLVLHGQWSQKFRDSRQTVISDTETHAKARRDREAATADLESATYGWDQFWDVPAKSPNLPADAPRINRTNQGLQVQGIGQQNGLKARQVVSDGVNVTNQPTIYAFYASGEGMEYAGEFEATNITDTSALLVPKRPLTPSEVNRWQMNSAWRLRTLVPAADRVMIEDLFAKGRRINELIADAQTNIKQQENLLERAKEARAVRNGELLGNPDATPVKGRPEVTKGLLNVVIETEEGRNQLSLDVDELRRQIQQAEFRREELQEQLKKAAQTLPGGSVDSAQIAKGE